MEPSLFNYEKSMHQQIETLFQSLDAEDEELENIDSEFMKLMQLRHDPPFEVIWIHSSPMRNGSVLSGHDFEDRMSLIRSYFVTICENTSTSGASKSIAMLAPICLWLSEMVVYVYTTESGSEIEDEKLEGIKSMIDVVLGHVSVCCSSSDKEDDREYRLCVPLEGLLALWRGDKMDVSAILTFTFTALTEGIKLRLSKVDLEVSELSGAVAAHLFLTRMGMSLHSEDEDELSDLEEEQKRWGVATLTAMKNLDLFVMLLQVLLEREPFTGTMASGRGPSLRAILYDVVLVDYSFLDPESGVDHSSSEYWESIAFLRLYVAHEAVEFFREMGESDKAISCENAFATSRLSAQILKLVPNGAALSKCKRNGSSPIAFLMWFVELEQQGVKVFSDNTTKYTDNLSLKLTKRGLDLPVKNQSDGEDSDADDSNILFSINKEAEKVETENEEELDELSNAFIAAANTMNSADVPNKATKRKSSSSGKVEKKQKATENDLSDSSDKDESKSSDDADTDESEE